jgi:hypothetical protein
MKVSEIVASRIDRLPKGHVFTYVDVSNVVEMKEAVIKALNRMANSGKIAKLAKGRYYKPESTVFGNLAPDKAQVVKDLLENNGRITGYLTGYSIYNQLGLSTQVSNAIEIGKNDLRPTFKRERYTITFVKQKNTITKDNIPFLQILDVIKNIKKIPDATLESSLRRLLAILIELTDTDYVKLIRLAMKYPPATRALLGALLEDLDKERLTTPLRRTLNPITLYKLSGVGSLISSAKNWNIR